MNIENEIKITFPDGNVQNYKKGITGIEIAGSISKSLSKAAVAIVINGTQKDLSDSINSDATVSIINIKSEEGIEIMRHTLTAQVLARAVKNLFPRAKLAIGPTIENGFYYDILFEKKISIEDFPALEEEMRKIISSGLEIKKLSNDKFDSFSLSPSLAIKVSFFLVVSETNEVFFSGIELNGLSKGINVSRK